MKKTFSILSQGKALCFALLTGMMFLLGTEANAQENAQGSVNPYTHIATKLDVTAYPLGTFERTHTLEVLEQILQGLKPLLGNGGGSQLQKLKYDYCNRLVEDIKSKYVAVEISLLTSLSALTSVNSSTGIQHSQLRSLYAEVVNQID
jgi:hypothetical protein